MIRTLLLKTWLLCSIMLGLSQLHAQGWIKRFLPNEAVIFSSVYATADSGFLATGFCLSNFSFERTIKINAAGQVLWQVDNDSVATGSFSNITQDGGLVVFGYSEGGLGLQSRNMMRLDKDGNRLWVKDIHSYNNGGQGGLGNIDLDTTDNGGFICVFTAYDTSLDIQRLYVKRLDGNGNYIWEQSYYDTDTTKYCYALRNAKDGGFIMGVKTPAGYRLLKIDGMGNKEWEYVSVPQAYILPVIARDGNILVQIGEYWKGENIIAKLDQDGNELWRHLYPVLPDSASWAGSIIERPDKKLVMMASSSAGSGRFTFCIADTLGNILLTRNISTARLGYKNKVVKSSYKSFNTSADGGYVFGGFIEDNMNNTLNYSGFIAKVDSDGVVYPGVVSGIAYNDADEDCQKDSIEMLIHPALVTFTGVSDTFTVTTLDTGYFSIAIDTGSYNIDIAPPSPYWEANTCNISMLDIVGGTDSILNLGFKPIVISPYIIIDGHISRQRLCMPAIYKAKYCNTGTAPFNGVLEIKVDSLLQVDSASTPWLAKNGNTCYFTVNALGIMECANLEIYCTVPCDANLTGRTTCIDAHAIVDTVVNSSPLWDKSNLSLLVVHDISEDSITFTLKNKGNGAMINPESLIVIEDNVILFREPVSLPVGGEVIRKVKANGATWRAYIPQTKLNPYSAFATAAIEGAGQNQQGTISTGYLKQFAYNGYYGYYYNTCEQIFNSYDPNQKTVSPTGLGADHIIEGSTALEYTLDFQNTGNDTAYIVRVMDTLPSYLDPATIRKGVSSHQCQMEIIGKNVISFTFYNINLPDSGANQLRSNGFVKFRIKQKTNNAMGTVIDNKVSIYFDYNPPIVTNTATVRIGELRITGIESIYANKLLQVNAFPNPFKDKTTIKIEGERFAQLELKVFDISGRLVKQQLAYNTDDFIIDKQGFNSGSYIFEISSNGKPVAKGKIMAE